MKKRALALLLTMVMLVSLLPVAVYADEAQTVDALGFAPAADAAVCTADASPDVEMDNDDLFTGYLYQISGLDPRDALEPNAVYPDAAVNSDPNVFALPAMGKANEHRAILTEAEQKMYDELLPVIQGVAANGGSTEHAMVLQYECAYEPSVFGADSYIIIPGATGPYDWNDDAIAAARSQYLTDINTAIGFNKDKSLSNVTAALLADLPYEMYWYQKTVGSTITYIQEEDQEHSFFGDDPNDGNYGEKWYFTGLSITVKFAVNDQYQDANSQYTVSEAKATAAQAASANAQSVVNANASKTDYEKLSAYLENIKGRVKYNDSALSASQQNSKLYGDPWQLIYVFDSTNENDGTSVVCEGYAKAFKYLCDLSTWQDSGFACRLVTGNMTGGTGAGGHMWNIVHLKGANYLVDVTNCDSGTVGSPDKLFLKAPKAGGSVASGYQFNTNPVMTFTYDASTKTMFTEEELTLAPNDFDPNAATTCTVTFDLNGKTITNAAPEAQTVAIGGKATEPTAPIADDFNFDGWYKEKECINAWNFATDTASQDTVLYAKWSEKIVGMKLMINATGGTGAISVSINEGTTWENCEEDNTVTYSEATPGEFTVLVKRDGCEFREVKVTYAENDGVKTILLCAKGDLNADGNTDMKDLQALFDYLSSGDSKCALQTEDAKYFSAVADIAKEGNVDILDYQALYLLYKATLTA